MRSREWHKPAEPGTVYWITGLSGAGKTTLGRALYRKLRGAKPNAVFLDGDELRGVLGDGLGHSLEDRRRLAMRYARLCRLLADQGHDVVCATISMFEDVRRWNRTRIRDYREIYVRAPIAVLRRRDRKGIYRAAARGRLKDVVGVDQPFEEPRNPDLVVDNDGRQPVADVLREIERALKRRGRRA